MEKERAIVNDIIEELQLSTEEIKDVASLSRIEVEELDGFRNGEDIEIYKLGRILYYLVSLKEVADLKNMGL